MAVIEAVFYKSPATSIYQRCRNQADRFLLPHVYQPNSYSTPRILTDMLTREQLLHYIFSASAFACLLLSFSLSIFFADLTYLLFAPLSLVGFGSNILLAKFLRASREKTDQLGRHVKEVSHHLEKQELLYQTVAQREALFRGAFESGSVGTLLVYSSGKIQQVNSALCKMTGHSQDEICRNSIYDLVRETDRADLKRALARSNENDEGYTSGEFRLNTSKQEHIWAAWSSSLIEDGSDEKRFIFHLGDITDRKRAEERLVHDAFHDSLTGLPNRALFLDRMDIAFKRSQRHLGSYFAVLFLDLDRFKLVNDSYGHLFGDELLQQIANRIVGSLRNIDTVARLGGDEFAILIDEIANEAEVEQLIERLSADIAEEYMIADRSIFATFSIGIAFWDPKYVTAEDLLRDADTALYQAKRRGRNRSVVFEPSMQENVSRLLEVETDLRKALARNEFMVYYQPIVLLLDRQLAGFEALIRWVHPVHGMISPAEFIPVAEQTGLIIEIGSWVLEESCRQLAEWQKGDPNFADLWISVNVSSHQFHQQNFVKDVSEIMERTGLQPSSLKLEITESMMVDNLESIVDKMHQLNDLGVRISIDDFGTGFSSLNNLHRLPLHTLKIDRSFVSRIEKEDDSDEIIRTIVSLAMSLGLDIVAEGIETQKQAAYLADLECGFGQGYLFGRPVDADSIRTSLLSHHFGKAFLKASGSANFDDQAAVVSPPNSVSTSPVI